MKSLFEPAGDNPVMHDEIDFLVKRKERLPRLVVPISAKVLSTTNGAGWYS